MGIYSKYYDEFPDEIRQLDSQEWMDFGEIMDTIDTDLLNSIDNIKYFYDMDMLAEAMYILLNLTFAGTLADGDTQILKREKIFSAVQRHRVKGREQQVIDWITEVTGVTPAILSSVTFALYDVWESKNNLMPYPYDFMKWASKNGVSDFGMQWYSSGHGQPGADRGVIYIDLKINNLSSLIVSKVAKVMEYAGAAYFEYHLGYFEDFKWNEYRQVN